MIVVIGEKNNSGMVTGERNDSGNRGNSRDFD
jgi:hypothetical protein